MAQENKSAEMGASEDEIALEARNLVRCALKGALATLNSCSGYPYASLVTLATDPAGAPILLLSTLALHTRNLAADCRASILIDATGAAADPLEGPRLTLFGRAQPVEDETVRRRFLARHPEASFYADFKDFAFWRLNLEGGHFIGGFGKIVDLPARALVTEIAGAEALIEAEPDIVAHMNGDHADAIRLYATVLAGAPDGEWRMSGIDPEGCDLISRGAGAQRIGFAQRVTTPGLAREELVRLAAEARDRQ